MSVSSLNWLKRRCYFSRIPKTQGQLLELLRHLQAQNLMDADTLRMIEGSLQIADMRVSEIMIPRAEMIAIPKDHPLEEILQIVIKSAHSRFPVIGESKNEVIGILLAKDLLHYRLDDIERFSIKQIMRPVFFIPESKRLGVLLNEFRKNRNHIAIVVDEYGDVSGLVTIEDVLEQIVGNIEDEHDIDKGIFIRKHKDNTYSIKATTPLKEFNAFFHTELSDKDFDTIGGLVLKGFGHLPKRGESLLLEQIPFTVLRANHRRIQLLQTTFSPNPVKEAER